MTSNVIAYLIDGKTMVKMTLNTNDPIQIKKFCVQVTNDGIFYSPPGMINRTYFFPPTSILKLEIVS